MVLRSCLAMLLLVALTTAAHAQTAVRTSCQGRALPPSVTEARAALDKEPDELAPRMRLANALVDQGCYDDAVTVLEAGVPLHPHSTELSGKLRDVRSLVTEQTYIQGMAQAADAAQLQHSQLRCTRFGDLESCNQALKFSPDETSLLVAKADALVQAGRPAEALGIYQHVAQLSPGNEAVRSKLAVAQARVSAAGPVAQNAAAAGGSAGGGAGSAAAGGAESAGSARVADATAAETQGRSGSATVKRSRERSVPARVAAAGKSVPPQIPAPVIEPVETPTFSNEAPAGRSN